MKLTRISIPKSKWVPQMPKLNSIYQVYQMYSSKNAPSMGKLDKFSKQILRSTVSQEQQAPAQNQNEGSKFWAQSTLIQYGEKNQKQSVYGLREVPLPLIQDIEKLVDFISTKKNLVVLTGAGVSTESNIPDYRGPQGAYKTGFQPMTHQTFVGNEQARRRYWARSFAGWYEFSQKKYNAAHEGLARLEQNNWVKHIITQNVDQLHIQAGSKNVIELHGTLHRVKCLNCHTEVNRNDYQELLEKLNPLTFERTKGYLEAKKSNENVQYQADVKGSNLNKGYNNNSQHNNSYTNNNSEVKSSENSNNHNGSNNSNTAKIDHGDISNFNLKQNKNDIQQVDVSNHNSQQQGELNNSPVQNNNLGRNSIQSMNRAQQDKKKDPEQMRSESGPFQIPVRRPDGDVELMDAGKNFKTQPCLKCGGVMKPDVVYFGDNVPKDRAQRAMDIVNDCDGLLIAGSSLQVWSAYRLAQRAHQNKVPLAIVNYGDSRADDIAAIRVEALVGGVLMALARHPILEAPCTL